YISTASNAESIEASRIDLVFPLRNFTRILNACNALIMGKKLLAKMLRNENSQLFFVLIN
ncbi:MAG: hypothetical protein ACJAV1_004035, partial [Paraglaciecola sp.]